MTEAHKDIIKSVPDALRGALTGSNSCGGIIRNVRPDLTPEELKRLQEYGSVEFKSAGATRKR